MRARTGETMWGLFGLVATLAAVFILPVVTAHHGTARADAPAAQDESAIERARLLGERKDLYNNRMIRFRFRCNNAFVPTRECEHFLIDRVSANLELENALSYARTRGVAVTAATNFAIGAAEVDVKVSADDEEIIRFLCGAAACPR